MRTLTDSEVRVIGLLLSSASGQERERLRQIGVPRSTYHATRKRAYAEGWLRDRYVPDPAHFGYPFLTFALVRPFAERANELAARWDHLPGNVLTWVSTQLVFGVFYVASEREAATLANDSAGGLASWQFAVAARSDQPSIPVFFDFEGLWANLASLGGTVSYPHGLGGLPTTDNGAARTGSSAPSWAATELVDRPFVAERDGRPGHLVGPWGLPWGQQRLLRNGWVSHRVLLDPARVPSYRGRMAGQIAFVTGRLRDGARPEQLFQGLTRDARVFPFLYVVQDRAVLFGAVGSPRDPAPTASADPSRVERKSVMGTLQAMLGEIDVLQEAAAQVRVVTDHRYDRLFHQTDSR